MSNKPHQGVTKAKSVNKVKEMHFDLSGMMLSSPPSLLFLEPKSHKDEKYPRLRHHRNGKSDTWAKPVLTGMQRCRTAWIRLGLYHRWFKKLVAAILYQWPLQERSLGHKNAAEIQRYMLVCWQTLSIRTTSNSQQDYQESYQCWLGTQLPVNCIQGLLDSQLRQQKKLL